MPTYIVAAIYLILIVIVPWCCAVACCSFFMREYSRIVFPLILSSGPFLLAARGIWSEQHWNGRLLHGGWFDIFVYIFVAVSVDVLAILLLYFSGKRAAAPT